MFYTFIWLTNSFSYKLVTTTQILDHGLCDSGIIALEPCCLVLYSTTTVLNVYFHVCDKKALQFFQLTNPMQDRKPLRLLMSLCTTVPVQSFTRKGKFSHWLAVGFKRSWSRLVQKFIYKTIKDVPAQDQDYFSIHCLIYVRYLTLYSGEHDI